MLPIFLRAIRTRVDLRPSSEANTPPPQRSLPTDECGGVGTSRTTATEYTVGTLIIDFYDARQRELVWRGSGEGKVNQARDPEESQERINQVVTLILQDFPVE